MLENESYIWTIFLIQLFYTLTVNDLPELAGIAKWDYHFMNLELLEKLKKLTIIAMVSDDYLMEKLVLKGGNALDLFYGISPRASLDLDFSMTSALKD